MNQIEVGMIYCPTDLVEQMSDRSTIIRACMELSHLMYLSSLVKCIGCALCPQPASTYPNQTGTVVILGGTPPANQGNTTPIRRHTSPLHLPLSKSQKYSLQNLRNAHDNIWEIHFTAESHLPPIGNQGNTTPIRRHSSLGPTFHSYIGQAHSKCHILGHLETKHRKPIS